jgi:hypothetical protein
LRRDLPVIELGGALGVVACVTNKLLAQPSAHVVVEANPLAIPPLTVNKEANHCAFEIVNRAIAYGVDSVTFNPTVDIASNSIESDGTQLYGTEQPVNSEAWWQSTASPGFLWCVTSRARNMIWCAMKSKCSKRQTSSSWRLMRASSARIKIEI